MLPPSAYEEARRSAPYHLQVRKKGVTEVVPPGFVTVCATVERVFRGKLVVGSEIEFKIPVARSDDDIPAGPVQWADYEAFLKSPILELYLEGAPPVFAVVRSQFALLDALTKKPTMGVSDGPGLAWWRFGKLLDRFR